MAAFVFVSFSWEWVDCQHAIATLHFMLISDSALLFTSRFGDGFLHWSPIVRSAFSNICSSFLNFISFGSFKASKEKTSRKIL